MLRQLPLLLLLLLLLPCDISTTPAHLPQTSIHPALDASSVARLLN